MKEEKIHKLENRFLIKILKALTLQKWRVIGYLQHLTWKALYQENVKNFNKSTKKKKRWEKIDR